MISEAGIARRRVLYGTAVHSHSLDKIEYLERAILGVDEDGVIAFVETDINPEALHDRLLELGYGDAPLTKLEQGEFLLPGFIDTHTHAPQYVNMAYGQEFELLDWLKHVTFPTERRFADANYARRTYESVVQRLIDAGTTTVCYYGTLHLTTKILAAVCHRKGQRAFVGKCNMDRLSADDYQEESAERSLQDTRDFVSFVRRQCGSSGTEDARRKPLALVQPIITPRFAIACSDELLKGLGKMLQEDDTLPCQTHLSENPSEIEFTKSLFPGSKNYASVYDSFGLLRHNTVLAHCVHLEDDELALIKSRNAGVSHCPNSNFNLRSGMARIGEMLDQGVKVSLGTDVSGGTSLGILSAIRAASTASKVLVVQARDKVDTRDVKTSDENAAPPSYASRHLSIATLLYLATKGGANVTCLEDRIGDFTVGKEFDALLVQTGQTPSVATNGHGLATSDNSSLDSEIEKALSGPTTDRLESRPLNPALLVEPEDGIEKLLEKFLFSGDDRNIGTVFVRGRVIGGARPLP